MTLNSLDTLEERIQKPGYLLFLVVVLLLLIVGFVDLIDYQALLPDVLGRYGLRYFVVMVGYTIFMLAWASLLLKPNDDRLITGVLDFLQMHPLLAVGALVLIVLANVVIINAGTTIDGAILTLPAFQIVMLSISLLFAGAILFYKWGDESRPQRWRKIVLAVLGILLVIELLLQALAFFGALPGDLSTTQSYDSYSPYNRIYQSGEGFGSGLTNNFGRYAPPFDLLPDSHRVAILGDSFVEGLQVRKEENFGVLLEEQLAAANQGEPVSEVLSLGHPDLGPGIYLSNWMLAAMASELEPQEAIILFDLGSDFQTVDRAGTGSPFFVYEGQGQVQLDISSFWNDLHEVEHYVHRGYEGLQTVLILKTNYLTPRFLWESLSKVAAASEEKSATENISTEFDIDRANGFVFNEQTNEEALLIASSQINMAREQLDRYGMEIKLVTNPTFTENFFRQEEWNTTFGNSDLLLPERELRQSAANYGIPFLGLGAYMQAQGLTPAEVQSLYFEEGLGHLTPEGHEFVAEALYECFYAQSLGPEQGCDVR